jgi:1,4-alpha-glucan branching enzyme
MSIKKRYLKRTPVCKVTFGLSKEEAKSARTVNIVGEFNNWDTLATTMKRLKDGSFTVTIDLEVGKEYQFRYLIDRMHWENDGDADRHIASPFRDSQNSVVIV